MKKNDLFIIAEVGVNHNGSINIAKKLIRFASAQKINAVKFQYFKSIKLSTKSAKLAPYQQKNSPFKSQQEMLKKYELSLKNHIKLSELCRFYKIEYMTSFFDLDDIKFHKVLKLKRIKIPSGEMGNVPYLEKVARVNKPILLSTGMANLEEIKFSLKILINANKNIKNKITLMQCTSEYPSKENDSNINVLNVFKKMGYKVGYSDHTKGFDSAIIAVALGATVVEKHLTIDNKLPGPDHLASLSMKKFITFKKKMEDTVNILGFYKKIPTILEQKNRQFVIKKIIAKKQIKKGEILNYKNLTTKRSIGGIEANKWNKYIGKISKKNYLKDDNI